MEQLPGDSPSCPSGCPSSAMQVILIPKDHLTLFCCRRCRLTLLQGPDGVSQFSARELQKLGVLRMSYRTGQRSL